MCGGRRGIPNLLHKLISRCLENRCQRLVKLLKLHVQLLDGHCHLLLWSRRGLLARGVSRRAQISYPQKLPTVDSELGLQSLSNCFTLLTVLTPRSLYAFHSELSAPPDFPKSRSSPVFTRQQVTRFQLFREATITVPLLHVEATYEMGRDIHTRVLRSREKGFKIRVTHVHTRSDCVHTRDGTVRLDNASRFVRVIYSSHIVSVKLAAVTPLRRCGLASTRTIGRSSFNGLPALVQTMLSGGATRTRSDAAICASPSGAARMSLGVVCQVL